MGVEYIWRQALNAGAGGWEAISPGFNDTGWVALTLTSGATFSAGSAEYRYRDSLLSFRFNGLTVSGSAISVGAAGGITDVIWSGVPAALRPPAAAPLSFSSNMNGAACLCAAYSDGTLHIISAEATGSARTIPVGGVISGQSPAFVTP